MQHYPWNALLEFKIERERLYFISSITLVTDGSAGWQWRLHDTGSCHQKEPLPCGVPARSTSPRSWRTPDHVTSAKFEMAQCIRWLNIWFQYKNVCCTVHIGRLVLIYVKMSLVDVNWICEYVYLNISSQCVQAGSFKMQNILMRMKIESPSLHFDLIRTVASLSNNHGRAKT